MAKWETVSKSLARSISTASSVNVMTVQVYCLEFEEVSKSKKSYSKD